MGLGFKRLFKRKSKADKAVRTPEKVKHVPETPPTQPVKEDPPSHNRRDGQSDDLPVRNLLKELNIQDFDIGTTNSGDTDPVFEDAEFPDDEPAIEPTTLSPKSYTGAPPHGVSSLLRDDDDDEEVDTSSEQTFDSPLRPRNLGSSDLLVKDDDSIIAPVGDQLIEKTQTVGASDEAKYDVTGTIMNMIERARQCASMEPCAGGVRVPKPIQKLVPTADNALLCQPLGGLRQISDLSQTRPKLVRQYSYFDDKFALKFLDVSVPFVSVQTYSMHLLTHSFSCMAIILLGADQCRLRLG